ncbi:MAG: extracellular solute-binding protein, partial [Clostridiales bacterium]|nr:extracellular solute-binding protein [Clostridiales bacterium]
AAGAEEEIRAMIKTYDPEITVSFVPEEEAGMRYKEAFLRGKAPDAFMFFADDIPDLAEEKQLLDLSNRLRVSDIHSDEFTDGARRACLYQGKTWAVPFFCDAYMLAYDRTLVSLPPQSMTEVENAVKAAQAEKGEVASFAPLDARKSALLYESVAKENGEELLNGRETKLTVASEAGVKAAKAYTALMKDASTEKDSFGSGKAAFSVLTAYERAQLKQANPSAEIGLAPLPVNRLQTLAIGMSPDSKSQTHVFRLCEFLFKKKDELSALYKRYSAEKSIEPLAPDDEQAVRQIASARPAPDLCGYKTFTNTYLISALERIGHGVDAKVALSEAAEQGAAVIWKGKRE